ncbi:fibroblast growth factor receptor 3-like [Trichoplusia ni]|uniref:Fibroblast growth factor receptor 3-like n=1 Tax=Trichoplusia ni TaxID=7111 RepID=A0A7E5W3I7_TRINI|nr:fibroblast growth factor receptor 3-like [Trichoplusia ni]
MLFKMCMKCFVLVLCCGRVLTQRLDPGPGLHEMPRSSDTLLPPSEPWPNFKDDPGPPDRYPVRHAGLPHKLEVFPLPLKDSDHELKFNVSWIPSLRRPAKDYSLEVRSITDTVDCQSPMCYEYNIPGEATWWLIPAFSNPVAEMCAVRPGCAYMVRLIAHPWDGHTSANLHVELDECVVGVCSCAHSPRLPAPEVTAETVTIQGEMFTNVSWTLPRPAYPQRLPSAKLGKHSYVISLGKQMVSDAHPAPWFANTVTREVDADGYVSEGDTTRWLLLPVSERSVERTGDKSGDRSGDQSVNTVKSGPTSAQSVRSANGVKVLIPEVKLLARVNLIDDRGCVGPAGNATAFDPSAKTTSKFSFGTYVVLAALAGAWLMGAVFALSARIVKRVLKSFRPAPVSAPLEPLNRRPAWFPLQLRTNNEIPARGQMEESPLYTQKEFEVEVEDGDEWEVSRSRVHLGALIGSGAFGRVHAATLDMPGGETIMVAAKMLTEEVSEEEIQDFLREIEMLKHVGSHKHVIRLIACCTRRAPLIALLEHAPRGDLLSLLRAARGRRREGERESQASTVTRRVDSSQGRPSEAESEYTNLSDSDPALSEGKLYIDSDKKKDHYVAEPALQLDGSTMREYALQVALGMRHLEERGITHRDLAARNILVDGAGLLKVADFGLSRSGVYVHTRSRPVPLRWLAPEAILHSQYCSASDVWAFAVLLWEIATLGGFPYAELSNHQVPSFLAGGGRLPKPVRASPRLYQLMVECWSEDSADRPTFAEIVDKLTVQKQLYVDLDCVFPPSEDEVTGLSDLDFSFANGYLNR